MLGAHVLPLPLLAFEEEISSFSCAVLPTVLGCPPGALSSVSPGVL